jgi:hypothetical protein
MRLRRRLSPAAEVYLSSGTDEIGLRQNAALIRLSREEWRQFPEFLRDAEALIAAPDPPICGALRRDDGACCVDLPGHLEHDLDHLWVGGRDDLNLVNQAPAAPGRKEAR